MRINKITYKNRKWNTFLKKTRKLMSSNVYVFQGSQDVIWNNSRDHNAEWSVCARCQRHVEPVLALYGGLSGLLGVGTTPTFSFELVWILISLSGSEYVNIEK